MPRDHCFAFSQVILQCPQMNQLVIISTLKLKVITSTSIIYTDDIDAELLPSDANSEGAHGSE